MTARAGARPRRQGTAARPPHGPRCLQVVDRDGLTVERRPETLIQKMAPRRREFCEDRVARSSIWAGSKAPMPDTLAQTETAGSKKSACRRGGPYVFEVVDGRFVPRVVPRPCRDPGEAERLHLVADRRLAQRDPELFPYPLRQIRQAPAHHLMDRRIGPRSTIAANAWRCDPLSLDALPGALPLIRPAGPRALKRS